MSRLPILMYHHVVTDPAQSHGLSIATSHLEEQFQLLSKNNYTSLHFADLEAYRSTGKLPPRSVIITFDDAYVSQLELAYPLLKKYNLKATFFVPFQYLDSKDRWHSNSLRIMSPTQLRVLDPNVVALGLHSFAHNKYSEMTLEDTELDFKKCHTNIVKNQLKITNILAYPYGKFPRKNPEKKAFFNCLNQQKIAYGLRIGNRVNRFPFKNNYEVQRIDIKGEDSLWRFRWKLKLGKLKLF